MKNLLVALLLLPSLPAFASSCEDSFAKKGNTFTGTTFSGSVSVANLSVDSALGQMRAIATAKGMDVLNEDAESGTMIIEDPETATHKPLPMIVSASSDDGQGQVTMVLKLNKGAMASAEAIKAEMCNMLGRIVSGKLAPPASASAPKPMEISATALSDMLTRQANDNLAAVDARYQGKVFKVSGRTTGTMSVGKGRYNVGFVSSDYNNINSVSVVCQMAKDQTANVLSMRDGEKLTMIGTFDKFMDIERNFLLRDCRVN